jgi:hypothetical protein
MVHGKKGGSMRKMVALCQLYDSQRGQGGVREENIEG